jgi:RNA polymerase sigma-70 factor (ECF subfamily)
MTNPDQVPPLDAGSLDAGTLADVRRAQHAFVAALAPARPDLYAYCRRLTDNPFDAEDLVQETLARALARAAQTHGTVANPIGWLVRIATNAHIDAHRRFRPLPTDLEPTDPAEEPADPAEVREALTELVTLLPPQERAAVALKDVFGYSLKEVAAVLDTTEGAVKAALHRGRGRLADRDDTLPVTRRTPSRAQVDAVVAAFNAYDIPAVTALFLTDGVSDIVGMVHETGREQMARGSLEHTFDATAPVRFRAETVVVGGEPMAVLWGSPVDASAPEAVADLLRFEATPVGIARMRWYFFCPEVLAEVAAGLGLPARGNGYSYT